MITIRPEQMEAFETAARSRFESAMLAYIREHLPAMLVSLGEARVRQRVQEGVDRAASYGASSEIATARFIELMLAFGSQPASDRPEWPARLLREDSPDPDRTIAYVYQTAAEQGVVTGRLLEG